MSHIGPYNPQIDPDRFTAHINNPYLTLRPGTTFVYQDGDAIDIVRVTRKTVVVAGVTCVVVHDSAYVNDILVEDTFDWYAQDDGGNVWYFGEDTKEFEPGNSVPVSTEGSWRTGVDGALPGIVMEAHPRAGDHYRQEFYEDVAEDYAVVVGLGKTVHVIYGSFDNALKTRDVNPLDPSTEHKYYVPDVGFVLATTPDGGYEQLAEIRVQGLPGDDNLIGYAGGEKINALAGHDVLRGLTGNDSLMGGDGNDSLYGGAGGDDFWGGPGNDWLSSGSGADSFIFHGGLANGVKEVDVISGYRKGQVDVIDLPRGAASIVGEALANGVWQLTLRGDGDVISLPGVSDVNHDGHIVDDLLVI